MMITIQNGKLNIPDIDRFVGFAGDNAVMKKEFFMVNHVGEGCTYTLCLRFDDDFVRTVPLTAAVDGDDTVLTWEIVRDQLHATGVVAVQLKIADSDGNIAHTTKDFFLVGSSVELDETGEEEEFVTTAQLRHSINQALEEVTATAPYIDDSGYWCIYDLNTGEYVRTAYHVSGLTPDDAMSDSSDNAVSNRVVKRYVDSKSEECNSFAAGYADLKLAAAVPHTRTIAQLPLSDDIGALDLMANLRPFLYKLNVTPHGSAGIRGQFGIGMVDEVFFCTSTDHWVQLASYHDLYDKMDLIPEIDAGDAGDYDDGSLLYIDGSLYYKMNDAVVALSNADDVYKKSEINAMIGNIEALLAAV
ncbi:hypothetical protein [Ruminococcus sp.]|uniref:hypothetical protein n=1 Tax=Ruminococcus sp. TaxID=41978 RepID=UPI0038903FB0